jgi:hypothetical protein
MEARGMRSLLAITAALAALGGTCTAQADDLTFFHTPSGNIHCLAVASAAGNIMDCEILAKVEAQPIAPRPADCELDWGNRFALGETGEAQLGCAGDTVRDDSGATLAYGNSFALGRITCASSEKGLECRNGDGHGFFLSRARQELF